jgi:hypothetical protein
MNTVFLSIAFYNGHRLVQRVSGTLVGGDCLSSAGKLLAKCSSPGACQTTDYRMAATMVCGPWRWTWKQE